jgi:hypothetical protein
VGCAKTIQEDLTQLEGVQESYSRFWNKKHGNFWQNSTKSRKTTTVVEAAADGKTYKVTNMKL